MKNRNGFISNSSSASFIIKNKSGSDKTLVDFYIENQYLIEEWNAIQKKFSNEKDIVDIGMLSSLIDESSYESVRKFIVRSNTIEGDIVFGADGGGGGSLIDRLIHSTLMEEGESENFKWRLYESYH